MLVVLVAMGGGALLSFGFEKRRGAAEISEEATASGEGGGTAPVFPAYKEEEANFTPFFD